MIRFHLKLKALKKALQVWNKETFGNIRQAVCATEDEVIKAEKDYEKSI